MNWLQFLIAALELPPDPKARQLWTRLARQQFIYALAGLVFGIGCIAGGLGLFLHGVVGSTSWVGEVIGFQSRLAEAAPGTILFIIGLAVVWVTRFSVRVRQPMENDPEVPRVARRPERDQRRKAG